MNVPQRHLFCRIGIMFIAFEPVRVTAPVSAALLKISKCLIPFSFGSSLGTNRCRKYIQFEKNYINYTIKKKNHIN